MISGIPVCVYSYCFRPGGRQQIRLGLCSRAKLLTSWGLRNRGREREKERDRKRESGRERRRDGGRKRETERGKDGRREGEKH